VTDTRVPEPSLEVPEEGDSVGKGETVVVSGTVLYTEVVTVLMKPCEGGSVGEGAVLVASGPVVYTDEDIALTIVVMKPGEGEPVGEGTRLVVSSPEEDTMVVTLAVEPDWKDSVGKEGTVVASSPVVYTDEDLVVAIVAVKPDEDDLVGVGALLLASGAVVSGGGDSVGEGASWVVSSAEEETMVVTLAGDSVDEGESLAVVTLAVELVDGSDIGEVMIEPTEEAFTETLVTATLVVPTEAQYAAFKTLVDWLEEITAVDLFTPIQFDSEGAGSHSTTFIPSNSVIEQLLDSPDRCSEVASTENW
jgi:hypothetical protein